MAESTANAVIRVHGSGQPFRLRRSCMMGSTSKFCPTRYSASSAVRATGKSVLLRTILGLRQPQGGTVEMYGRDMQQLSRPERLAMVRSYGVTFQNGALISSLSVAQNIQLPLREYYPMPEEALDELAELTLAWWDCRRTPPAKYPAQLSGGMVKRAALARALSLEPKLLVSRRADLRARSDFRRGLR